jgi:hypothetical protein
MAGKLAMRSSFSNIAELSEMPFSLVRYWDGWETEMRNQEKAAMRKHGK